MKNNFLPAVVADFQRLQQTRVEAGELRRHLEVAVEPGPALAAEPAVVRSIGSRQHSLHSLRTPRKDLRLAG
jgi:hypothetical protein